MSIESLLGMSMTKKKKKKVSTEKAIGKTLDSFFTLSSTRASFKPVPAEKMNEVIREFVTTVFKDLSISNNKNVMGRLGDLLNSVIQLKVKKPAPGILSIAPSEAVSQSQEKFAAAIPDWRTVVGASLAFDTKTAITKTEGPHSRGSDVKAGEENPGAELGGYGFIEGSTDLLRIMEAAGTLISGQVPYLAKRAWNKFGEEEGTGSGGESQGRQEKGRMRGEAKQEEKRLLTISAMTGADDEEY